MTSLMSQETRQTPGIIASQLAKNASVCQSLATRLSQLRPRMIMIIGRGSSDHAGVFAKYLFEVELGIPVCAAAPSVSGVYHRSLQLEDCLAIVISQSGRSPDILNQTKIAREGGAYTLALVNDETSPLATMADAVLPVSAGPERAVAATKSYLATLTALLQLCSYWSGNQALLASLGQLPDALNHELNQPAQLTEPALRDVSNAVVLGRGFGYAAGREIALKLKEVLGIHAEAFSSAEFIHGPVTLAEKALHVINVHVDDESVQYHDEMVADVQRRGATIHSLLITSTLHPRLKVLLVLLRFYLDIEAVAVKMGLKPDSPPGLNKVTETV